MAPNAIIILFAAVLLLASCGKGGEPTPPPPPAQNPVLKLLVLKPWKVAKTEYKTSDGTWVNVAPKAEVDTYTATGDAKGEMAYTINSVTRTIFFSLSSNNTLLEFSNSDGPIINFNIVSINDQSMVVTINGADGKKILGYYYPDPNSEASKPYYDLRTTSTH